MRSLTFAVGKCLTLFFTPLGTLLLAFIFVGQTRQSVFNLLLYVLLLDFNVLGTFGLVLALVAASVALLVTASAFATAALLGLPMTLDVDLLASADAFAFMPFA